MKKYLIVTADSNDADYVTKITPISDKVLALIKPVIKAIKEFKPYNRTVQAKGIGSIEFRHDHNYPRGEGYGHRPDEGEKSVKELYGHLPGFEEFDENYRPHGYEGTIHTITKVRVLKVIEDRKLL